MTSADDRKPSWIIRMEQVEWAKLAYAYGEATDVSALIQAIAFGEEAEAREACTTLHDELVHQASIYSSTYEAIPFLIEALGVCTGRSARCRGVLRLLDIIADSALHWIEMAKSSDLAFAESEEDWYRKFIERTWHGADIAARLLRDEDPDIRAVAAHLLGMLVTLGPGSVPADAAAVYTGAVAALLARLRNDETDELALSSIVFALGRASAHDLSLLEPLRTAGAKPTVGDPTRVAAALAAMALYNGRHASLQEADLLIDTMCRAADTDMLYLVRSGSGNGRRSPWVMAKLRFKLRERLCAWSAGDQARMERVLPALLTDIRLASGYTAETDLGSVFRWLWPERHLEVIEGADGNLEFIWPPPVAPEEITGMARRVVQACYDNPGIWQPPVGNTDLAFRHAGLPETRAGLKTLLDGI